MPEFGLNARVFCTVDIEIMGGASFSPIIFQRLEHSIIPLKAGWLAGTIYRIHV